MERDARTGVERIADERRRQVEAEGYSAEHDDGHIHGELADAAACYAASQAIFDGREGSMWPWDDIDDKRPSRLPMDDERIRLLEKAGALIAAEIDRLLRKQAAR